MAKAKQPADPASEGQVDPVEKNPVEQDAPVEQQPSEPAAGEAAEQAAAPALTGDLVRARVLVDGSHGKCNDVIEIDSSLLAALTGSVDATPEAVAYAESLAQ
jgi:hypothetical protein